MIWYSDCVVTGNDNLTVNIFSTKKQILGAKITVYNTDSVVCNDVAKDFQTKIILPQMTSEIEQYTIEVLLPSDKKMILPFTGVKLNKDEPYIVCDIDFTVSATNVFLYMTENIVHLKTIINSIEVLNRLATKYKIIYLTGRIEKYTKMTKTWIERNNYPIGPILARPKQYSLDLEVFKSSVLKKITNISRNGIGIGDLDSDIGAYMSNGIIPIKIKHPLFYHSKKNDFKFNNDYYTVSSWYGIESIFNQNNFFMDNKG